MTIEESEAARSAGAAIARLLSLDRAAAIAHRGGSKLRPENTLAAFEHARALGADAIECDVHLSKDHEVVVIHDATLDRTTDASGPVEARTADELAGVDAGYHFGGTDNFPFRGQRIGVPRLDVLLARLPQMPVIIEIKGDRPIVAERALEVIRRAGAEDRVIIGGFSDEVLHAVRRLAPAIPTSASRIEVQSAIRRGYLWLPPRRTGYRVFQIPLRVAGRRVLSRSFVRTARRAGFPVQAWVIDDAAEMRELLDWGVTGLISDRPDLAVEAVGAHIRAETSSASTSTSGQGAEGKGQR